MQGFLSKAPGAVWAAIIVGIMLLAEWLTTYFGAEPWVPPLAGLLAAVIVPILKVLFEPAPAVGTYRTADEDELTAFEKWLL